MQCAAGCAPPRGRPAVRRGPALAVVTGADAERVTHDHPAGSGSPRRLEHKGARQVTAPRGDRDPARPETEVSRTPVEDCSEDAWAVRTWQTHPLDPTARRDEAVDSQSERNAYSAIGGNALATGDSKTPGAVSGAGRPSPFAPGWIAWPNSVMRPFSSVKFAFDPPQPGHLSY